MVLLTATGVYLSVIILTRLSGLRSFSKMSSFDFAMTVAIGSVIATTVVAENPPLLLSAVALVAIYGLQIIVAILRLNSNLMQKLIDNRPMVLMVGTEIIEENMRAVRVTKTDLLAKLREANVLHLDEVKVVVLESTGDISVMHGEPNERPIDSILLENVRGRELVPHITPSDSQ